MSSDNVGEYRNKIISVYLDAEASRSLDSLSESMGKSKSGVIRSLLVSAGADEQRIINLVSELSDALGIR